MQGGIGDKEMEKIEKARQKVNGYEHQSFPFIRPEKEELFSQTGYNKGGFQIHQSPTPPNHQGLLPQVKSSEQWTNPEHMERLERYLEEEQMNRV